MYAGVAIPHQDRLKVLIIGLQSGGRLDSAPAARPTNKTQPKVGQPNVMRPLVGASSDVVAAPIITASDQNAANAWLARQGAPNKITIGEMRAIAEASRSQKPHSLAWLRNGRSWVAFGGYGV